VGCSIIPTAVISHIEWKWKKKSRKAWKIEGRATQYVTENNI